MGFLGVYTAVYDYQPQAEGELEIREGDLLYILEKSNEDDWWKAKKKADPEDEEPVGLVPNNYIEETDEEVSFSEDAELVVYDTSDPDWTLVGVNSDFGFAPANYIELLGENATTQHEHKQEPAPEPEPEPAPAPAPAPAAQAAPEQPAAPALPQRPQQTEAEETETAEQSSATAAQSPAAAIAGILHKQHGSVSSHGSSRPVPPPPQPAQPAQPARPASQSTHDREDEDERPAPALPRRPPSQQISSPRRQPSPPEPSPPPRPQFAAVREHERGIQESPPYSRVGYRGTQSQSGYHIYNISEMVSVMGKRKKMPTTLGINVATGTIFISPEDGGYQEWTADKLTHYSIEGKHVFLDLVRPSRSIDFHAGAKDTAQEIVSALGEIAGAYKAEGLREVIAAGRGGHVQKRGQVLYDFMAQGDDEVTVAVGDEVIILDDSKSDEWWMVRRVKNGREGVVPSSYIEITGIVEPPPSTTGINAGRSTVEQNRLEEERLAKEAARKSRTDSVESPRSERQKQESKSDKGSANNRTKPDPAKTRRWVDRTGTFTVEAQFLGLHDGKIHLHKMNGIKIAVPIEKMSIEDLEYVEKVTGQSLDEDKPLSDIRRRSRGPDANKHDAKRPDANKVGAQQKKPEYDWFDFFLKAGVDPYQCERYAQNFTKDSMDESVLPDITPDNLRTLGLKEGDILRVMRYLDNMFGRTGSKGRGRNVSFAGEEVIGNGEGGQGGLFSGPGGALRNNTRRPTPGVQAPDTVDPKAFQQKDDSKTGTEKQASDEKPVQKGFDDDAWEVKPPKQSATSAASTPTTTTPATTEPPKQDTLTGAMADLSLLQEPLKPTPAQPNQPAQTTQPASAPQTQTTTAAAPPQPQQPQLTGANPSFFASGLGASAHRIQQQQQQQQMPSRQRPQPPQNINQSSLLPPPPQRPLSAPQEYQQSSFAPPPLQPQLTGIPQNAPQVAPPGQSLAELSQQRFQQAQFNQQQQQQPPLQPQPTGFAPQFQQNGLMPQPTGFGQQPGSQFGFQQQQPPQSQPQPQQQFQTLAPQPTGFGGFSAPPQQPMQTGINSVLPPPLQPQRTGVNGFGNTNMSAPPAPPPIPQQPTAAPLQPQKTGPPPNVRFGVKTQEQKKLTPQPTGLRANLAQATPTNPFGF
ncbi:Cytoskeleton assembly control protein Sla1 [Rasamsonia emersonii CBS 393.64]|uniref:Actin cytoskeleton-regulatory complex protein SLA1 n=1 Tax=Rasamsonia emersonii (strain ATCC 16479 / CBS 393.64 / IMI 116815) TaxID=1408163 RepID=A0A0F4YI67_RASE3|nr:Cytoskeleton assembly control protein Sla1 [Rasamsonia emersonii CBS 393.64]KKA17561.1 Cytoskeleton assembly control protein Sla1 [Rasamsonia emersonii CBS 393.64]